MNQLAASARWVPEYFVTRIPPGRVLLPLVTAFACSTGLYASMLGVRVPSGVHWLLGMGTFVLLFVQLRLVDDLDDAEQDSLRAVGSDAEPRALKRRLRLALGCVLALLVALNVPASSGLLAVIAASLLTYLGPFVIKRYLPPRPLFLALAFCVFEGAPALCFAYIYVLAAATSKAADLVLGASATAAFWLAYEFWKFSRKVHLDTFQPYFLKQRGLRRSMTALLVCAALANVALAGAARFGKATALYLLALPLVLLAWVNWSMPRGAGGPAPLWSGMTYMVLLEAAIALELLRPGRTPS